ncbi:MAG: DUF4358 domain-containing protein [Oscillospiraceae bacterium]
MKKVISIICAALMVFLLVSCTKQNKEINVEEFSKHILETIKFKDELVKINDNMVERLYSLETGTTASVYVGSGATAEELAIFKTENNDIKQKMLKNITTHIENQKEAFKSYIPKEVEKLEKSVVFESGNYIIVIISDEPNAKAIAEKYIG